MEPPSASKNECLLVTYDEREKCFIDQMSPDSLPLLRVLAMYRHISVVDDRQSGPGQFFTSKAGVGMGEPGLHDGRAFQSKGLQLLLMVFYVPSLLGILFPFLNSQVKRG